MEQAAQGLAPMMNHMFLALGAMGRAFYEKCGDEALPIIAEGARKSGAGQAEIMQKMMPVKSMKDIGEMLKMMGAMMGMEMEIVELTDDTLHFKGPKCLLGIDGTSKGLCEAMMNSDKSMMSTLLGREVEMNVLKSVAAGDKECEVIFSAK
jgi:predicted hydrocarbon binding protein